MHFFLRFPLLFRVIRFFVLTEQNRTSKLKCFTGDHMRTEHFEPCSVNAWVLCSIWCQTSGEVESRSMQWWFVMNGVGAKLCNCSRCPSGLQPRTTENLLAPQRERAGLPESVCFSCGNGHFDLDPIDFPGRRQGNILFDISEGEVLCIDRTKAVDRSHFLWSLHKICFGQKKWKVFLKEKLKICLH